MQRRTFLQSALFQTAILPAAALSLSRFSTTGELNAAEKSSAPAGESSATAGESSAPAGKSSAMQGSLTTRGIVLTTADLLTLDWPELAAKAGLTTIATHIMPSEVIPYMQSSKGKRFVEDCHRRGLKVEHELHSMRDFLPRSLFAKDPSMFRMNAEGNRTADFNCCPSSQKALDLIAENAVKTARICRSDTERYFYWIDDAQPLCSCPKCRDLTYTDQAVLIENAMLKALQSEISPKATLAHLAYHDTIEPPKNIKPLPGLFLEFAPIHRLYSAPLSRRDVGINQKQTHDYLLKLLDENLKIFPATTAQALEYWIDVSFHSRWKKPAKKLPWNPEICRDDVKTYVSRGIKNITSFAVYIDRAYRDQFHDLSFINEYGKILRSF